MKTFNFFNNLSLKYQLILGVFFFYLTLVALLSINFFSRLRNDTEEHFKEKSKALVETLAVSSTSQFLNRDLAGLAEVVKSITNYEDTKYIFITDKDGKVLAHSNSAMIGKYVSDEISKKQTLQNKFFTIASSPNLIDVAAPILLKQQILGWARLGLSKEKSIIKNKMMSYKAFFYIFFAIAIGLIAIGKISHLITRQLDDIIEVVHQIELGDSSVRAHVQSKNEIGKLAEVFNSMLDNLKKDQVELIHSRDRIKESEERFELAMKGSRDGLWDLDYKTGESYYSERWLEMLGLTQEDIVKGQDEWSKRIHPEDFKIATEALNIHLTKNTPNYECEQRLLHKNGKYIWTIGRGVGIRDENGETIRIVGTQSDISLQKNAEIEKEQMFNHLRQSQKMEAIGQLTGGIAHDFNNILAGIMGFSDLGIKRSKNDDKTLGYLFNVSKLATRGRDLIRQMLIYSRGGDPDPKIINTQNVIEEALHLLKPIIGNDISIFLKKFEESLKIKIDPVQFQQIIMNLSINARDSMEGRLGEIKIELASEVKNHETCISCGEYFSGKYVKLKISDNGTGIDKETLRKIFEPFFSTKLPGKGTGMGLSMVHGIVHRHNGHINVNSRVDHGTEFLIYFPEVFDAEETQVAKESTQLNHTGMRRILVVDDEDFMRDFVTEFLKENGHECISAENGKVALDILKTDKLGFDLVITDYTMPEMNGIELIENIRVYWPSLLIILSSGNIDIDLEKDYRHLRIDGVLLKPYEVDDAVLTINNLLQSLVKKNIA